MTPDKYTIRKFGDIYTHLAKYRDRTDPWQADFYDIDDIYLCSFESDEETMEALQDDDALYAMVTEMVDFAMMMGKEFDM